jgi:hypothetical protein
MRVHFLIPCKIFYLSSLFCALSVQINEEVGTACKHTSERSEIHTEFWLENLKGRYNSEDLGMDDKISKWILKNKWIVD